VPLSSPFPATFLPEPISKFKPRRPWTPCPIPSCPRKGQNPPVRPESSSAASLGATAKTAWLTSIHSRDSNPGWADPKGSGRQCSKTRIYAGRNQCEADPNGSGLCFLNFLRIPKATVRHIAATSFHEPFDRPGKGERRDIEKHLLLLAARFCWPPCLSVRRQS